MAGQREQRVQLGVVAAPHGVRGLLRVRSFTETPEDIGAYGPLSDDQGRRWRLEVLGRHKGGVLARLDGVGTREAAERLRGLRLYVARSALPAPAEDEFYHADLIGLDAVDAEDRPLGRVRAVHNFGAGDVLELERDAGRPTLLVPFTRQRVPEIDLAGGRLKVASLEGLEEGREAER